MKTEEWPIKSFKIHKMKDDEYRLQFNYYLFNRHLGK